MQAQRQGGPSRTSRKSCRQFLSQTAHDHRPPDPQTRSQWLTQADTVDHRCEGKRASKEAAGGPAAPDLAASNQPADLVQQLGRLVLLQSTCAAHTTMHAQQSQGPSIPHSAKHAETHTEAVALRLERCCSP